MPETPPMDGAALAAGEFCYDLAKELFPICRSLTGHGVRVTLQRIAEILPGLEFISVPSGTQAFDWTVPDEWNINDAYIADEAGNRIVDFRANNLHVVGYSEPVDTVMGLDALKQHLYSLPERPDAIPYVTSYYQRRWGFCLAHRQLEALPRGNYRVRIDSELRPGNLNLAELVIRGNSDREVLLSTYVCHPSMANNELSGPVVTTALARWLQGLPERRHTYRIVFLPETIGSIVYLSRNLAQLKRKVVAGFNITCVGDDRAYSYLPSRNGATLADRAALHVLQHFAGTFHRYSWLDRGSDERQYCAPGIDLPVASIMRSKYAEYPEYHTSLDNLDLVSARGLAGGYEAIRRAIEAVESDRYFAVTVLGEPQLGKRGLYPTLSTKESSAQVSAMMDMISYLDGTRSLLEIADLIRQPVWKLVQVIAPLLVNGLVVEVGEDGACT